MVGRRQVWRSVSLQMESCMSRWNMHLNFQFLVYLPMSSGGRRKHLPWKICWTLSFHAFWTALSLKSWCTSWTYLFQNLHFSRDAWRTWPYTLSTTWEWVYPGDCSSCHHALVRLYPSCQLRYHISLANISLSQKLIKIYLGKNVCICCSSYCIYTQGTQEKQWSYIF